MTLLELVDAALRLPTRTVSGVMAMEPITIFSRNVNPVGVARRLRELAPGTEFDGPEDRWTRAAITFGDGSGKRSLTLFHDLAEYAEPKWSNQMAGMRGYFNSFPRTDRKELVMVLTTSLQFSLGTVFEPDFDPTGDPRLDILFAVTEFLDGVLFTPSSLRDAKGRILFGAGGEDEEDPNAVWPRVLGAVSFSDPLGQTTSATPRPRSSEDDVDGAQPPTAQRVARRALAMAAVTGRAILEQGNVNLRTEQRWNPLRSIRSLFSGQERQRQELLEWLRIVGIESEFEPDEWEVLQRPCGRLEPQQQIDSTWRLEGLVVLASALGRFQLPAHDKLVEFRPMWQSLGLFDAATAKGLIANPSLKSRAEIATLRNRLFAIHWRLRNFNIDRKAMNFDEFAKTCWFGPLDITGLPLVEGDLAIHGRRIDRVSPGGFGAAHSAARERHQAANWLMDGPEIYSKASVAT
jgi:hypothetical protein